MKTTLSIQIRGGVTPRNVRKLMEAYNDPKFAMKGLDKLTLFMVNRGRAKLASFFGSMRAIQQTGLAKRSDGGRGGSRKAYDYTIGTSGSLYLGIQRRLAKKRGRGAQGAFFNDAPYARKFEFGLYPGKNPPPPRPFMFPAAKEVMEKYAQNILKTHIRTDDIIMKHMKAIQSGNKKVVKYN